MAGTATAVEAETTSAVDPLPYRGRPDGAAAVRTADIFERHSATVLGLCRMLLRNEHEAEDAVQQTFLAAHRSIRNGVEPRHPAAWLATIARNECWAAIERRMREPLRQGEPESGLPDPVAQAAARADLDELWRAIGELPGRQRQALLLRELSGLTYAELAGTLGVTEPAVESLLVRARRALRARLRSRSGSAAALAAPLCPLREALVRLLGLADAPSASGLAKLATGAAVAVVAGGTVAAVESPGILREVAASPAEAAIAPRAMQRPTVRPAAVPERVPAVPRANERSTVPVRSVQRKETVSEISRPVAPPAVPVPRPAEPQVSSPRRGAAPAPLPDAAPAPEQPTAQAPSAAAGDGSGPGSGTSGEGSPGPGGQTGDEGGGALPVESSGPGSGADEGSGSASSGPGGDEGQGSSGEGPGSSGEGGADAGEGGGDRGTSGSGDDDHGEPGGGGDGGGHGRG
jgi:RNA polymerase sigma factor (sigma-70 family)